MGQRLPEDKPCGVQPDTAHQHIRGGYNEPDIFREFITTETKELAPYNCYIVRCRDNTLYTGITNDLERRISVHNKGKGGAYTAARRPVELVYSEYAGSKGDALRRELEIKSLSRSQKLALILQGTENGSGN